MVFEHYEMPMRLLLCFGTRADWSGTNTGLEMNEGLSALLFWNDILLESPRSLEFSNRLGEVKIFVLPLLGLCCFAHFLGTWKSMSLELFDVCVCECVCISFHRRGFSWLKQNNKCNARDQTSDVVLRKLLCVKYLRRHVIDNYRRDLQASNCVRVSIKPGRATRSKRQILELSKNQRWKREA